MGSVGISLKVMGKDPSVDLKSIGEKIKAKFNVTDLKVEPLAFGLKQLRLVIVKPDKSGGTDEIENFIKSLDGVESVEVESVTLI